MVVLVGFVGVVECKEEILEIDILVIVVCGRKGGSNFVVVIINVILIMM